MRSKVFSLMMSFGLLLAALPCTNVTASEGRIAWSSDYDSAVKESKAKGKPILLFFTGSGWCSYCQKLEREVFNTPQFARAAGSDYIFVKLDFSPRGEAISSQFKKQHSDLINRHAVRGYPTVVLLNSQEKVLMTTGYRAGGAEQYIAHLQGAYAKSGSL